ncbi:DUF6603 domain-containing protein [Undibacterium sp. JH2W]|uniref:DUF6603 domain-containing protein n=1 Tax=Undibacterium sp. JH2W TaxID=3413037 RepID=UPI003BF16F79
MDFEQLQKVLRSSDDTLDLWANTVEDDAFKTAFERVWGTHTAIKIQQQDFKTGDNSISFGGKATLPEIKHVSEIALAAFECQMKASFSLEDDGSVHALLDFSLDQPLSKVFRSLPDAFEAATYDEGEEHPPEAPGDQPPVLWKEILQHVHIVFSTHDCNANLFFDPGSGEIQLAQEGSAIQLAQGLNLLASWTPDGKLALETNRSPRPIWGSIVMPGTLDTTWPSDTKPWEARQLPPGIHVQAALSGPVDLPAGITIEPAQFRFYTPLTREWLLGHTNLAPVMAYVGKLKFDHNSKELIGQGVLAAETWDDFNTNVQIECTFDKLPLAKLEDLWGETKLELPEGLSALEQLTLNKAIIRLVKGANQAKHEIAGFAFVIALGKLANWPIVKGKIDASIDEIRVFIDYRSGTGLDVRGRLSGSVSTLGTKNLMASIDLPGFAVEARLTEPYQLDFNHMFSSGGLLEGYPKFRYDSITLSQLNLSLNPEPLEYNFSIVVNKDMVVPGNDSDAKFSLMFDVRQNRWMLAGVAIGQEAGIPLGRMLEQLAKRIESFPPNLTLPDVLDSFELISFEVAVAKVASCRFSCTGQISIEGKKIQAGVNIDFAKDEKIYKGWLSLGEHMFSFTSQSTAAKDQIPASSELVAAYKHWSDEALGLGDMMGGLIEEEETRKHLNTLKINLKNAFLAHTKTNTLPAQDSGKYLFGMDLGAELKFTSLPLVGKYFNQDIGIRNLQVIYAQKPFTAEDVARINPSLPQNIGQKTADTPRPPSGGATANPAQQIALAQGLNIAADLNLGFAAPPLAFPMSTQALPAGATPTAAPPDSAIWLNIQKAVGPIHVERIGVEYRQSKIWVLLSASMTAAGLSISLDGLGFGVAPSTREIDVSLRGLGIDYSNGFVEIGGNFLRLPSKDASASTEYSGAAIIKAKVLTISALGSYTIIKDEKDPAKEDSSFFIYGLLDYPIGGPPFFFVTGLAAGFGYNRNVVVPPIERLAQFPLIEAAQNKTDASKMLAILQRASAAIPATVGQHFLAAGVMFSSFKMVESTVLLTAAFGKKLELHLLGLSTMRIPSAELGNDLPAVAEVELALKGSFIPDDGFLELRAQLTPTSYLFSRDCHLTGGFAFLCWFKDSGMAKNGDFVLTLGGYHPHFQVLKHYPVVPRLGFSWQLQEFGLSLQGDAYFALTPSAIMAGGHLQVIWKSGAVMAWLKAGIDFLIAWMPYHYDAQAYVDIGIQLTFEFFGTQRLSLEVGADLHIWGPEFAGDAKVHLWIISFTIHFGKTAASQAKAIGWDEFKKVFLPEQVCSIVVADGLVRKGDGKDELGIINGKHFRLVSDSLIPSTSYDVPKLDSREGAAIAQHFGVAPMGLSLVTSSRHSIKLTPKSKTNETSSKEPVSQFSCKAITKNVPFSLWGSSLTPQLHGPQFVDNALCGFEIKANEPKPAYKTAAIKRQDLLVSDNNGKNTRSCTWGPMGKAFTRSTQGIEVTTAVDTSKRNELLKKLGVSISQLDNDFTFDYLVELPQVEATP